jgi:hypothetical protein
MGSPANMASQPRLDIGKGWFEMQDKDGRIYYANKHTKLTSRDRPPLSEEPSVRSRTSRKAEKVIDSHPEQVSSGSSRVGRNSKQFSAGAHHASVVLELATEPPRRRKGPVQSSASVKTELESSPFQDGTSKDEDVFEHDVPTSFVRRRNVNTPSKSLALMLEDAMSARSGDISDHQVAAIRQYFQDLNHVSVRSVQDLDDHGVPSSSSVPALHNPLSNTMFATPATPALRDAPLFQQTSLPASVVEGGTMSLSLHEDLESFHSQRAALHRIVHDVHISGATGVFADIVNGVYEPTLEHCCGMTVYCKRGDNDKWLEYSNEADRWAILDTKHRGQVWGWAYLTTHRNIEKCKGLTGWKIASGSRTVDDLNIRVNIVERLVSHTDFSLGALQQPTTLPHNAIPSSPHMRSHGSSIIEQLERTLTHQPAAAEESYSGIRQALDAKVLECYQRNVWAVVRMQALFRGKRDRKNLRQKRMSALVRDLADLDKQESTGLQSPEETISGNTHNARLFNVSDAVDIQAVHSFKAGGKGFQRKSLIVNDDTSPKNTVAPVFHPVHRSSSKNRSAINAIIQTGVQLGDVDPDQLLRVLKKSKLFKDRKIGKKIVPNAAICCELVDFSVINFRLGSRAHAIQVFQKLVDSKHLELPDHSQFFKDEHAFVVFPRLESDKNPRNNTSLFSNSDFSVVVESIWRDNNIRIACAIVGDVMSSREPRASYEGWRSNLHDIAYNKGLRAVMFCFLLAHLGLGFYVAREISWTGECQNHPSELLRFREVLYAESGICALYVMYLSIRILAGFAKSLKHWFIFESALIIAMCADVGYSLGMFDGVNVTIRFSLPLRALMIACWSNRLRIHMHEIFLSVRKLKVLGGAVLLWIIISATLVTIYVRMICSKDPTEGVCGLLTNSYFDNAATAMVTLAIMMTTSNYGTISQLFLNRPGQSTTGIISVFVGLVIFMIVSYFLLLSMMLAIVFDAFKKGKRQIMSEKSDVFDAALIGAFSLLCERDSMSIKHDTYRRFMRMLIPNISPNRIKKYWQFLDADESGSINLEEFLELSTIVSFQVPPKPARVHYNLDDIVSTCYVYQISPLI